MVSVKKLFNNHILVVSTVIILTSFTALFFVNSERFYDATSSSSILAPEFDFNAKLNFLTETQKQKAPLTVRDELLLNLANEHIPIIMCCFYDLITGPKRLQRPDSIDEGRWLQQLWAEFMENMGIPRSVYMSIMELRYSWFTETKDSFETFQAKLEPSFVKATLERYIKANGNFIPTSVEKYNQALQCKLYRTFSKSASLLNYMKATSQQSTTPQPTTQQSMAQPTASATQPATTTQQPGATATQPATTTQPTASATQPATTTQPAATASQPATASPPATDPSKPAEVKSTANPVLKWVVPANFTAMCLEKGNRLQCFLMSILVVIFVICIIMIISSSISSVFYQQPQSQF